MFCLAFNSLSKGDMNMTGLKEILGQLVKVENVNVAVCVGRDGFVIDAASSQSADTDAIGAMVSTGMGSAESVGRELGLGVMDQAMMEYNDGIVMMTAIGSEALLAVVANKNANLGNVRLQVRRRVPELEKELV
jgi:uncharacterized protein